MSHKTSTRNKQKRREPWTSNNRVLMGSGSKKIVNIGRNPNFDTDETKLLIQLWGDPKVQRTLITTHKKHAVLCQLATKMQEYGYVRSAEEITTRIKNLKCFYNRLKKDMESSTTSSGAEPTWKHYADMDAIMTRPIFSVRPNEVPAPSLKYQLEQKREERAERRRRAIEEGKLLSDSDDLEDIIALSNKNKNKNKHDIDDGIIPDVEVDIDAADEAFVAFTKAAKESMAKAAKKRKFSKPISDASNSYDDALEIDDPEDEDRLCIKEEENSDNISEDDEQTLATIRKNSKRKLDTENKESRPQNKATNKNDSPHSINENTSDSCVALIIPKDEPIDVDADEDDEETAKQRSATKKLKPSLSDMLKVAISSAGNILIPVSNVTTTNSGTVSSVVATLGNAITSSSVKTPTLTQMQQSKISLVPTNFLMPQKSTAANATNSNTSNVQNTQQTLTMSASSLQLLKGSMTPRIVLGNAQSNKPTTTASTGIVTTGPGGMKVLLVNTEQAKTAAVSGNHSMSTNLGISSSTLNSVLPLSTTANGLLTQQQQQHQQQHISKQTQQHQTLQNQQHQQQQQQLQQQEQVKEAQRLQRRKQQEQNRMIRREELLNKRETTGMRILLRQLLNAQTENNEVQRKRFNLERERLEFEKNIAERFLSSLPSLLAACNQQQQQHQQQQQQQHQHQIIFQSQKSQPQTAQLRINPQQLVFATGALPTKTLTTVPISSAPNSNPTVLTTSATTGTTPTKTPTENCTQLNDMQLITPKVENEDSI